MNCCKASMKLDAESTQTIREYYYYILHTNTIYVVLNGMHTFVAHILLWKVYVEAREQQPQHRYKCEQSKQASEARRGEMRSQGKQIN